MLILKLWGKKIAGIIRAITISMVIAVETSNVKKGFTDWWSETKRVKVLIKAKAAVKITGRHVEESAVWTMAEFGLLNSSKDRD